MTRRFRRYAASLAIVTLLLAQLIVAAHACPYAPVAPEPPAMHCHDDGTPPGGGGFDGHCPVSEISVPASPAPLIAMTDGAPLMVSQRDAAALRLASSNAAHVTPLAPGSVPPTILLHSRLRI